MINSKEDLKFYIKEDMKRNLHINKWTIKEFLIHKYRLYIKANANIAVNLLIALRKLEYSKNCLKGRSFIGNIIYRYRIMRFAKLSYKYNITLHLNTIGYGLYLPHLIGGV